MQEVQVHTLIPLGSAFSTPCNTGYCESVTASPAGVRHISVFGFAQFPKDIWCRVSFLAVLDHLSVCDSWETCLFKPFALCSAGWLVLFLVTL